TAKVLLLAGTMPLAWFNMRHNVPAIRRGRTLRGVDPRPQLRRYVIGEIMLIVLVIAVTAALIQSPPARTQVQPPLIERVLKIRSGGSAQVIVDPARAGGNEVHVYVFDANKRLDDSVTDVKVVASN